MKRGVLLEGEARQTFQMQPSPSRQLGNIMILKTENTTLSAMKGSHSLIQILFTEKSFERRRGRMNSSISKLSEL